MCGEMAGEPLYTLALIGLGLNELSMNAANIPRVKRVLRQVSLSEAKELVDELLTLTTAKEISAAIDRTMRQRLPEIFDQPLI